MSQVIGCNFGFSGGGSSSGAITGGGTVPKIAVFTSPTTIGDGQMSDDGTTVFIGTSATSTSAMFEVKSTTQGALFPRMTTAQRDLIPVGATEDSLFIFNTSIDKFQFYDTDAGIWQTIESSAIGGETWSGVLTNGATSGGVSPEMSDGDVIKAVNGGGELNLRNGGDGIFSLSSDNGGFTQSYFYGSTTTTEVGYSTNKLSISNTGAVSLTSSGGMTFLETSLSKINIVNFSGGIDLQTNLDKININSTASSVSLQNNNNSVGMGISTPELSAKLDITSTTKGFLTPRMTEGQRGAIASPATGLLVYQTDATSGFYYYNGSSWVFNGIGTDGIYGGNGTTPSATTASITDTLTFGTDLLLLNDTTSEAVLTGTLIVTEDGNGEGTHTINGVNAQCLIEVHSENAGDLGGITIHRHTNTSSIGGHLVMLRSNGTHDTPTVPTNGDIIGRIINAGYDGTDYAIGAEIQFSIDGTPANNAMPSKITFHTSPSGSQSDLERMRITASGNVGIGTTPTARLHIKGSGASSATKSISIQNSSSTEQFFVRDDGMVSATNGYSINGGLFAHQPFNTTNTMIGKNTPTALTSANGKNTAIGYFSLYYLTNGYFNVAIGAEALQNLTVGRDNCAIGNQALQKLDTTNISTESYNVAVGNQSLNLLTSGTYNVGIGLQSGANVTSGNRNVLIGYNTGGTSSGSYSNSIAIGSGVKFNSSNQMVVGTQDGGAYINEVIWGAGIDASAGINPTEFKMLLTNIADGKTDEDSEYDFVLGSSKGTGTGVGGSIIFRVAPAGSSGTSQNSFVDALTINGTSRVGIGVSSPTAYLHIKAGTATASTAPLKFTTGVLNTTEETGAMEFASDFFYLTANSIRTAISTFGRTEVNSATYTALVTDRIIGVTYTDTGACTINLPSAALFPAGYPITVKDEGFNASTFNITIDPSAAQEIDEATTAVINGDGDSLTFYSNGVDAWFII